MFYLQLTVKEGKLDRTELERWMAVGIVFVINHAQQKRRILIRCAQGKGQIRRSGNGHCSYLL
jgi:hypothetical protein